MNGAFSSKVFPFVPDITIYDDQNLNLEDVIPSANDMGPLITKVAILLALIKVEKGENTRPDVVSRIN